ncbi:hypothetical protein HBH1_03266 [Herbaspirillum sp. BH-1]|uniref:hypothetical protein n=1 Tax=Herbaspirillum sp. (strain BH-1) TaxID=2058884 RepID=UPI000C886AE1|nr:hypothetical protein [Herbaspirillum sp. BH-1]PLY58475.1 hypothetical protein HBH1_03266 [Herbaspirillum sp. BH-1]
MQANETVTHNDEDAHLEALRINQGLDTIEQTLEWLVKTTLRESVKRITGRGRALYEVKGKDTPCE